MCLGERKRERERKREEEERESMCIYNSGEVRPKGKIPKNLEKEFWKSGM